MFLRTLLGALLVSGLALAADSRPVCPGPAAAGDVRCHSHVVVDRHGNPNAATAPSGYSPAQFQGGYSLPAGSTGAGTGQVIGIVDAYDDPNIESDLGVYSNYFGLPACTTANGCFKKVNQTGGTSYPAKNAGWALEISLDVEIAHAVCPNCKILLVEASSASLTNLLTAEATAIKLGATVISNSWGASESSGETSNDAVFNHAGLPITVSAGDNGYGVEWPAASQYVTAVGGTTLTLSGNSYVSETVWSGTGSGCSAYEPQPAWQASILAAQGRTGCTKRVVADVSADADPNTGAAIYDTVRYSGQSGWFQVGGTSLASPLIAAVYALAGNGASTVYGSYPYNFAGSSNLNDVTKGSNGSCGGTFLCTGVAGFDGPTGVGTPKGPGAF